MTINEQDSEVLNDIREQTRSILRRSIGPPGTRVALIDTPRHRNLGDSLIWQGEVDYLDDLGIETLYHMDQGRFRAQDVLALPSDTVLLLHGGGNMGDLYPSHEAFRRLIIDTFRTRRIVSMPQSIHFTSSAAGEIATRAYSHATNLTLLARDHQSLARMRSQFPDVEVVYCPDAAFGSRLAAAQSSKDGVLILDRTDAERRGDSPSLESAVDWSPSRSNQVRYWTHMASGVLQRRAVRTSTSTPRSLLNRLMSDNASIRSDNVSAAVDQFRDREGVVTNRLHAHILATLLGKPNVVIDNTYGKIHSIVDAYSGLFSTTHKASSLEDGLALINQVLST